MSLEQGIADAIERAYEAGYCKGVDDTLALKDHELRELIAAAVARPLSVVK